MSGAPDSAPGNGNGSDGQGASTGRGTGASRSAASSFPPLAWLGRGVAAVLALAETRVELAATELEEERLRLGQALLTAALALFFIGLGLVMASFLIVVLCWDSHRVAVLAGLTALYLGLGLVLVGRWQRASRARPPLLAETFATLRRDAAALRGQQEPDGAPGTGGPP